MSHKTRKKKLEHYHFLCTTMLGDEEHDTDDELDAVDDEVADARAAAIERLRKRVKQQRYVFHTAKQRAAWERRDVEAL